MAARVPLAKKKLLWVHCSVEVMPAIWRNATGYKLDIPTEILRLLIMSLLPAAGVMKHEDAAGERELLWIHCCCQPATARDAVQ